MAYYNNTNGGTPQTQDNEPSHQDFSQSQTYDQHHHHPRGSFRGRRGRGSSRPVTITRYSVPQPQFHYDSSFQPSDRRPPRPFKPSKLWSVDFKNGEMKEQFVVLAINATHARRKLLARLRENRLGNTTVQNNLSGPAYDEKSPWVSYESFEHLLSSAYLTEREEDILRVSN